MYGLVFDYIGEPTPANGISGGARGSWPSPKNSYFGIVDTAGFPKDSYYFYQSQWNENVKTLHVLPTWNEDTVMKDGKDKDVEVVVYSDAKKVELWLDSVNGESKKIGEQTFTTVKSKRWPSILIKWLTEAMTIRSLYDIPGSI